MILSPTQCVPDGPGLHLHCPGLSSYKLELAGPRSRSGPHSEMWGQVVWFLETVRITGQVSLLSDLLHFL